MQKFPRSNLLRGIAGAVIGGVIGFFIFHFFYERGYYALVIPGALVGIGFEQAARKRHIAFAIVSAFMGLASCLIAEWRAFRPFDTFHDFLWNFKDEGTASFMMLGIGVAMAFWFGWGRDSKPKQGQPGKYENATPIGEEATKNPYQPPSDSEGADV